MEYIFRVRVVMVYKHTLQAAQQTAISRGGICLSTEYKNGKTKMEWQCHLGHIWKTTYGSIVGGSWCPYCHSGLYERICRCYFEQLFKSPFPKMRPSWLKNSMGNNMELDGYCEELKLAFEHNGKQHYKYIPLYTHDLDKRKADDIEKIRLCKENGVTLIVVPEIIGILPLAKLREFIKTELQQQNYPIPPDFDSIEINMSSVYISEDSIKYEQLQEFAASKNGKLLSEQFIGTHAPHKWACNICGFEWEARPHDVIGSGSWCPKCSKRARGSIQEMKELAKSRGGECLSQTYKNHESMLKWKCGKCNYIWETSAMSVKNGKHWCPSCAKQGKPTIEYINNLAEMKNGKCLDAKDYKRAHDKLSWKCSEGHEWKASYANIRAGKWCPYCSGNKSIS